MWSDHEFASLPPVSTARQRSWRTVLSLLPAILVLTILASLVWLPWQAQKTESGERQEQLIADTLWVDQGIRLQLAQDEETLRSIGTELQSGRLSAIALKARLAPLLAARRELRRVLWLDVNGNLLGASDDTTDASRTPTERAAAAADQARRTGKARYSAPATSTPGVPGAALEYHLPLMDGTHFRGSLVATFSTAAMLETLVPWWFAQDNEITLTGADDNVLERRAAGGPGRGIYTHSHVLDLPGANLTLRTNSLKTLPKLLPNLLIVSVLALSLALVASLVALRRDIARRLAVESALRQQVSFRTAMENSLVTGLRARDLEGRVTYVNPAFCEMVGTQAHDLVGRMPPMSYWAPEAMADYQKRFSQVLAGTVTRQGFETIFQRASGKRFPVLIFESPLVDDSGRQTGWMGSILDISDRKKVEDLNRRQQEKLESNARLASMGEIASTLAHELNQPLAAISSYTTGALNLLAHAARPGPAAAQIDAARLQAALEKANAQAQRAGQIIRSVHAFVKQREPTREAVSVQALLDGIAPLVQMQAQPHGVAVNMHAAAGLPPILADRVLIEQVLLNLTRNAIESMEHNPLEQRLLRIVVASGAAATHAGHVLQAGAEDIAAGVRFAVIDCGHGIAADVGERLFSPFYSTKAEGMGMGLNICRTAIEFHGGRLHYHANPDGGTTFSFDLPAAGATLRSLH